MLLIFVRETAHSRQQPEVVTELETDLPSVQHFAVYLRQRAIDRSITARLFSSSILREREKKTATKRGKPCILGGDLAGRRSAGQTHTQKPPIYFTQLPGQNKPVHKKKLHVTQTNVCHSGQDSYGQGKTRPPAGAQPQQKSDERKQIITVRDARLRNNAPLSRPANPLPPTHQQQAFPVLFAPLTHCRAIQVAWLL